MKEFKFLITAVLTGILIFILNSCIKENDLDPESVIDIDGNVYRTITIGDQVWMAENLRVTHYRNGDPIPNMKDSDKWSKCTSGAYCVYENTPEKGKVYGKLYNWHCLIDDRNIAPKGWHLPSDKDWSTLVEYLGGENYAGDKLREKNPKYWLDKSPTNESGFTGLPGGRRTYDGSFIEEGDNGYWWSKTEQSPTHAYGRGLYFYYSGVARGYRHKNAGFSVRCIKD